MEYGRIDWRMFRLEFFLSALISLLALRGDPISGAVFTACQNMTVETQINLSTQLPMGQDRATACSLTSMIPLFDEGDEGRQN